MLLEKKLIIPVMSEIVWTPAALFSAVFFIFIEGLDFSIFPSWLSFCILLFVSYYIVQKYRQDARKKKLENDLLQVKIDEERWELEQRQKGVAIPDEQEEQN